VRGLSREGAARVPGDAASRRIVLACQPGKVVCGIIVKVA
jgi:hypothetical protein